jgi:hypothetical protein
MKKVRFSENTKIFDGSSEYIYENYKILAPMFGKKILNIKKNGISESQIYDLKMKYNKIQRKIYPKILEPFSVYIKQLIKENVCNKESFENLDEIYTVQDCLKYCKSIDHIDSIIFELEEAISNIIYIRDEEINNKKEINDDVKNICEKEGCDSSFCEECEFLKRIYLKKKMRKVSLIRKGSRDYSLVVPVNFEIYIRSALDMLKDARDIIEERYFLSFLRLDINNNNNNIT